MKTKILEDCESSEVLCIHGFTGLKENLVSYFSSYMELLCLFDCQSVINAKINSSKCVSYLSGTYCFCDVFV